MANLPVARVWTFRSSSNPNKSYETLQYTDGSTSCNCPGWTRRVDAQGNRSCRHTRSVHQGTATASADAFHDYTSGSQTTPAPVAAATPAPAKKQVRRNAAKKYGKKTSLRKIRWQDDV